VGSLVTQGTVQTLTVPIDATYRLEVLSPDDVIVNFKGTLVATRTLPATTGIFQTLISLAGNTVTLTWSSNPGDKNNIESSIGLSMWGQRGPTVISTGPTTTWTAPKSGPVEFFRRRPVP